MALNVMAIDFVKRGEKKGEKNVHTPFFVLNSYSFVISLAQFFTSDI